MDAHPLPLPLTPASSLSSLSLLFLVLTTVGVAACLLRCIVAKPKAAMCLAPQPPRAKAQ